MSNMRAGEMEGVYIHEMARLKELASLLKVFIFEGRYHLDLCKNVFGEGVYPDVDMTNIYYGGTRIAGTTVVPYFLIRLKVGNFLPLIHQQRKHPEQLGPRINSSSLHFLAFKKARASVTCFGEVKSQKLSKTPSSLSHGYVFDVP
ncbi:putative serine protease EDA2 [Dendrobium catenatum]|uniref:Putative serine protease EDA2 n=1 Tax=Dendrobium catenatum TaxID=906689 RepID=A0A2I0XAG1_9ASPA|nr:putative serine protease EDA2 [Dendrobium catenatum]